MESNEALINPAPKVSSADLLRQILEIEKKQLRIARIRFWMSIAAVVLALLALVALFLAARYVQNKVETAIGTLEKTADNLNGMVDSFKTVDFKSLEESYHAIADVGTDTLTKLQEQIDGMDGLSEMAETTMTALQEQINGMTGLSELAESTMKDAGDALQNLNSVDIDALNNGIKSLNDVLKPIADFFASFGQFGR